MRVSASVGTQGELIEELLNEHIGRRLTWHVGGIPLHQAKFGTPPFIEGAMIRASEGSSLPAEAAPLRITCTEGFAAGTSSPIGRGTYTVGRDLADISLSNPHLPPFAAILNVTDQHVVFRPANRRPVTKLACGETITVNGSRLELEESTRKRPLSVSYLPLPKQDLRLASHSEGWKTLLVTGLLPILFGMVTALVWNMWFMLLFGCMSSIVSLAHWWTKGRGKTRHRKLFGEARSRELDSIARLVPPIGARIAEVIVRLESPTAWSRSPPSPLGGLPYETTSQELWVRWGRGPRVLHISDRFSSPTCTAQNMPLLTSLRVPHLLLMSTDGREDGMATLLAHLLVDGLSLEWAGCPEDCDICREFSRRWGQVVTVSVDGAPLFSSSPVSLVCANRFRVENGPGMVVFIGLDSSHLLPPAEWGGILISPSPDGLVIRPEDAAKDGCIGTASGAGMICSAPDIPPLDLLEILAHVNRSLLPASRHVTSCRLSTREDLAIETASDRWSLSRKDAALVVDFGRETKSGKLLSYDLNEIGPHCVVAGTTGSGKSEFLRGILTSLALRYPPDRIGFILIDFKGGTSFGPVARLPHVHSTLSDLDEPVILRGLAFIEAEIRRRESLFADLKAHSWPEYTKGFCGDSGAKRCPLPEILVAVDEFRLLVDTFPTAMDRLMHVAAAGRSLGIHLVMSTQRPQGAISADIRANVSINVCFRVASGPESVGVIGTPQAAELPATSPGTGYVSVAGSVLHFHALHVDALPRTPPLKPLRIPRASRREVGDVRTEKTSASTDSILGDHIAEFTERVRRIESDSTPPVIPPRLDNRIARFSDPRMVAGSMATAESQSLYLGHGEIPRRAWQGPVLWTGRELGALEVVGPVQRQLSFATRLLMSAAMANQPIYAISCDPELHRTMTEASAAGLDIRGAADLADPLFVVEVLAELIRTPRSGPSNPALVIVQGTDRLLESFVAFGYDLAKNIQDLMITHGAHWNLALLGGKRLPPDIRQYCPAKICAQASGSNEFRLSHPRESAELLDDLWVCEGTMSRNRGPLGLLPPSRNATRDLADLIRAKQDSDSTKRRPIAPVMNLPLMRRPQPKLTWCLPDHRRSSARVADPEPCPAGPGQKPGIEILVGVSSPLPKECRARAVPGEALALVYASRTAEEQLLDVLTNFNPHLGWRIFETGNNPMAPGLGQAQERSHAGSRPNVAVVRDVPSWSVAEMDRVDEIVHSHRLTILTFPMGSPATITCRWAESIRCATSAIFAGPIQNGSCGFRPEPAPPYKLRLDEDEGFLLSHGTWERFRVPRVAGSSQNPRHIEAELSLAESVRPQEVVLDRGAEQQDTDNYSVQDGNCHE
ncbi:FtsK/SpoIIIE domain-containing protein [Rothia uropygialis]|uniref:FtsK/SpoIIIE domain-containing protein n=1 Tax=Kocuria sp. 36 TaxID=1415402 RepID=UPI0013EA24BD|nr:FtsK/SpoIIIE domain-containing protein [Kocuria sp. 36]